MLVTAVCDSCGKVRKVPRCDYRDLCPVCVKNTPEFKAHRSQVSRAYFSIPENREAARRRAIERFADPREREKAREAAKRRFERPEEREAIRQAAIKRMTNEAEREKARKRFRAYWSKPENRERIRGSRNRAWNPSLSAEDRLRGRKYPEYYEWRKAVYERDNFTCQCCGQRGGKLVAHHIESYADNPDLRTVVENGVTLCRSCHDEFHRIYGKGRNNRAQFEEFLKMKRQEVTTYESTSALACCV